MRRGVTAPRDDAPGAPAALRRALRAGDDAAAFGLFHRLLARTPPDRALLAWIAGALAATDLPPAPTGPDGAVAEARADETAARLLFARVAAGAGFSALALAALRRAVTRAPGHPGPPLLLCAMLLKAADPAAQAALHHCLDHVAQPAPGWAAIGRILLERGKREAALLCLARGEPDAALALQRGRLARDLGRLDEARASFAEAVRLDPHAPRAWFLLGAAAQDAGDRAAAAAAYRAVLALDPGVAEAAVNLGTVLQDDGDLPGAKAAYAQAVRTRPDTFGRVAQALSTSRTGELWLDLAALRRSLIG